MLEAIYEVSLTVLFIIAVLAIGSGLIYGFAKLWQLIYCIYHARKDMKQEKLFRF